MLALLVRVDNLDDGSSRSLSFQRSPVRIGRNTLNDLPLEFPFVSQWHAVVQFDEASTVFYDLGSTNGTLVQGQRIGKNEGVPVASPAMDFRIGAVRLHFARGRAQPGAATAAPSLRAAPPDRTHPDFTEVSSATMMLDATAISGVLAGAAVPGATGAGLGAQGRQRVLALAQHYEYYRAAWKALYEALYATLQSLPAAQVPAALALFLQTAPQAAQEPELRALAQSQGVAVDEGGGVAAELVGRLANYFMPQRPPPRSAAEVEGFLVRVLWSLEVFGTAYVALRKGQDELNTEMMGYARRGAQPSPVDEASDPRAVLGYLLDWNSADAEGRVAQLKGSFAEIMSHQVALLSGLMEGVRKLFAADLSPATLLAEAEKKQPGGFFVSRETRAWRQFVAAHKALTEEDKELTSAIFGRAFARAYARALGENLGELEGRRGGGGGR